MLQLHGMDCDRREKRSSGDTDPRPIVVAAPRSGFSLLIHVANAVLARHRPPGPPDTRNRILRSLVDFCSDVATRRYQQVFERFGVLSDLVFNGEFHLLVGGPKWISSERPERAYFRKYFGVRGMGDFLLVTSHPRALLEYYPVIHSHVAPPLWLEQPCYDGCPMLTSVRNPIGIINSATFSLNAMASEYVQTFMPRVSEDFLRNRLALYKLTDLQFFRGLVTFLKSYLDQYLPVRDQFHTMRWEDLIMHPARTIQRVGAALECDLSEEQALEIWKPMDHVNLLHHHKHNYRHGKGIVGDWKNSLVNEHMNIFREYRYDDYLRELGYPPVPVLDPREYSPYQRLVAAHVGRGEVYRSTGDDNLFNYAFNKSNIDASAFNFKSYPKREWTHVERSCLNHEALVEAVSDAAERLCEDVNPLFDEVIGAELGTTRQAARLVQDLNHRLDSLLASDGRGRQSCQLDIGQLLAECA
jgi:Sulfotransferase domain